MTDQTKTTADMAAEKLQGAMKQVAGRNCVDGKAHATKYLCEQIGRMLIKFCYQSEDFAAAVVDRKGDLYACTKEIIDKGWDKKGVSDVEAYADAVKYYMPGATVRATFRIDAPRETDDDLFFDEPTSTGTDESAHTAIILDLFGED